MDVHKLKTISGGGILDPDDQLNDVCDDREQVSGERHRFVSDIR